MGKGHGYKDPKKSARKQKQFERKNNYPAAVEQVERVERILNDVEKYPYEEADDDNEPKSVVDAPEDIQGSVEKYPYEEADDDNEPKSVVDAPEDIQGSVEKYPYEEADDDNEPKSVVDAPEDIQASMEKYPYEEADDDNEPESVVDAPNKFLSSVKKYPYEKADDDNDLKSVVDAPEDIQASMEKYPYEEADDDDEPESVGDESSSMAEGDENEVSATHTDHSERSLGDDDAYQPFNVAMKLMKKFDFCCLEEEWETGNIRIFNGRIWQQLSDEELNQLVYDQLSVTVKKSVSSIKRYCRQVSDFIFCETRRNSNGCFTPEEFKMVENRVVFSNGVYDIVEDRLYSFSKELPYLQEVRCEYLAVDAVTPYYDKLCNDATGGDVESLKMFDWMIAYLLIPNRSAKCFFLMSYAKDSGKTILGEWIYSLFDPAVCRTFDPDFLDSRFSLSGLDRVSLLTCLEMNTSNLSKKSVAQLKTLTGESRIRMEEKYKGQQTISLKCKILLGSNGGLLLPLGAEDPAFYRRLIVIPFVHSTPLDQLVADLPQYLQEEKSAIVSRAVRKLRELIREDGGIVFKESALSMEVKAAWYKTVNPAEVFLNEYLEGDLTSDAVVFKDDLNNAYLSYLKAHSDIYGGMVILGKDELVRFVCKSFSGAKTGKVRKGSGTSAIACIRYVRWKECAFDVFNVK